MGETINTSKMAEFVSSDIFKYFGWERVGSTNINWECVAEEHGCATHPSDAVYQYLEPYQNKMTYVLCDFKSYAKTSISKESVEHSLKSLNNAVACAKISPDWHKKFRSTEKHSDVKGMLFIYNHDGEFHKEFQEILIAATKKIKIIPGNVIYVMDPTKIIYFLNVANNMKMLRGESKLPEITLCGYYYPELNNMKLHHDTSSLPLTLEYMGGSTHIVRYGNEPGGDIVGLDIYTPNTGEDTGYFLYILDYLRKTNCLQENKDIRIFMPFGSESASTNLDKAKKLYTENVDDKLKTKIESKIRYEHMPTLFWHKYFSEEIGMRGV